MLVFDGIVASASRNMGIGGYGPGSRALRSLVRDDMGFAPRMLDFIFKQKIQNMTPRSRGAISPEFCKFLRLSDHRGRRECRALNAPQPRV
jgi:hypothetical protein